MTAPVGSPGARETLRIGRWGLPRADKGVTATLGPEALLHNAGVLAYVGERAAALSSGTWRRPGCSGADCWDVAGGEGSLSS